MKIISTAVAAPSSKRRGLMSMIDNISWNYFCTFTSSYYLSLSACRTLMWDYYKRIRKYDGEIFFVAEPFSEKLGYHIHALVFVPKESVKAKALGVKYYERMWQEVSNNKRNRCLVTIFDPSRKANMYITKDLMLIDESNFDLYNRSEKLTETTTNKNK
ncbi:MAG: hypothetical protein HY840_12475 [Bacteroidetes bacterium]|nr:hypothetical protein [Bacteroidota bacterium]